MVLVCGVILVEALSVLIHLVVRDRTLEVARRIEPGAQLDDEALPFLFFAFGRMLLNDGISLFFFAFFVSEPLPFSPRCDADAGGVAVVEAGVDVAVVVVSRIPTRARFVPAAVLLVLVLVLVLLERRAGESRALSCCLILASWCTPFAAPFAASVAAPVDATVAASLAASA